MAKVEPRRFAMDVLFGDGTPGSFADSLYKSMACFHVCQNAQARERAYTAWMCYSDTLLDHLGRFDPLEIWALVMDLFLKGISHGRNNVIEALSDDIRMNLDNPMVKAAVIQTSGYWENNHGPNLLHSHPLYGKVCEFHLCLIACGRKPTDIFPGLSSAEAHRLLLVFKDMASVEMRDVLPISVMADPKYGPPVKGWEVYKNSIADRDKLVYFLNRMEDSLTFKEPRGSIDRVQITRICNHFRCFGVIWGTGVEQRVAQWLLKSKWVLSVLHDKERRPSLFRYRNFGRGIRSTYATHYDEIEPCDIHGTGDGVATVLERSKARLAREQCKHIEPEYNVFYPDSKPKWADDLPKEVELICDTTRLVEEGIDMGHCAADYAQDCLDREKYILSIVTSSGRSTVSLDRNFLVSEHLGYKNSSPPVENRKILDDIVFKKRIDLFETDGGLDENFVDG